MATEITMPQLGETVVEGTITKWLKKEGDTVEADEYIVEISTDKVDSEVPSSAAGVIQKILVQEGETVNVGTPIAVVGEDGAAAGDDSGGDEARADKGSDAAPGADEGEAEEKESEREPSEDASQPAAEDEGEPPAAGKAEPDAEQKEADDSRAERESARKEPSVEEQTPRPEADGGAADGDTSKRGIISPLVRRLAEENDVDLDEVSGTGTGGRIRKQDVLRFVEERKARPAARQVASAERAPEPAPEPAREEERAAATVGGREELVPWTNIRRRTAEHMVASHLETARAWNAVEVDWTDVVKLRDNAKGAFREREGFGLTFMPFLAKALCETLLEMPVVNSTFDQEQQGNRLKYFVNLGIAVALEGGGLIVPVVKAADEKNLVGLARGINDVATRARSKKLSPDDVSGGTFTITNPGPFGSIISVPIIPQGQTAIVGFEAIQKRVVVTDDDAIAVRSMGFVSMSWDHRAIDGAEAARFLAALRERIESTDFSPELASYL